MSMSMEATTETRRSVELVPRLSLTPAEAADALGLGRTKLWELTTAGQIPHLKLGKAVRYPVDGLKKWLAEQSA